MIKTKLEPWFTVQNASKALQFYQSAFGVNVTYKMESPDGGLVLKLSIEGAEFWLSDDSSEPLEPVIEKIGGGTVRMILTVADPDSVYRKAIAAGAIEVFPVAEEYGWRLGRLVDPFGLHWEIGHPLE